MEFIVKCSSRWQTRHYYRQMSFDLILREFEPDENGEDSDIDELIDNVANMDINAVYSFEFFMNDTYTFKRIS
jgi:hypothetical protein